MVIIFIEGVWFERGLIRTIAKEEELVLVASGFRNSNLKCRPRKIIDNALRKTDTEELQQVINLKESAHHVTLSRDSLVHLVSCSS